MRKRKKWLRLVGGFLLICVAAALTGCSAADETPEESAPIPVTLDLDTPSAVSVSNTDGLSLTTTQKELSGSDPKIEYSLENSTDTMYTFGPSAISIEGLQDGEWYCLAIRPGAAVHNIAAILEPHNTFSGKQSFFLYGDCVPAGTYRLVIGLRPDGPDSSKEYLAAEFSIVE